MGPFANGEVEIRPRHQQHELHARAEENTQPPTPRCRLVGSLWNYLKRDIAFERAVWRVHCDVSTRCSGGNRCLNVCVRDNFEVCWSSVQEHAGCSGETL